VLVAAVSLQGRGVGGGAGAVLQKIALKVAGASAPLQSHRTMKRRHLLAVQSLERLPEERSKEAR